MPLVPASDGLPGRSVRPWNDDKLFYVERYLDIFSTGMKDQWGRLVYADFFSGPGICVFDDGRETDGPPIVAARREEFKALFFNDLERAATSALSARLDKIPLPQERIRISQRDCNDAVEDARSFLFPPSVRGSTLGLAFIDPTAYAIRFDSIAEYTQGIKTDLIVTFMTGYAQRFLRMYAEGSPFDLFMGTRDWLKIQDEAPPRERTRQLLDLYRRQLATIGYNYVDDTVNVRNTRDRYIYHLLYASKSERGLDFWRKISKLTPDRQGRLLQF